MHGKPVCGNYRYLKACSTRTISSLELIKNSRSEDHLNEHIRELELDLMWLAKILVLKFAMMYSEANILRSTSGMTKDNAKLHYMNSKMI